MSSQLSFLEFTKNLSTLPTAKIKPSDKVGMHGWTNFYASFSESFATHTLLALGVKAGSTVLDPFVGSGTTLISASKLGANSIGIDLDPFACLLSRAKFAFNADEHIVQRLLSDSASKLKNINVFLARAHLTFSQESLQFAATVFSRIKRRVAKPPEAILDALLSDRAREFDSEVVALVALCIGASNAAKLIRGSNPTWYRSPVEGETTDLLTLKTSAQNAAKKMLGDLALAVHTHTPPTLFNVNVRDLNLNKTQVDYVLTSPPYMTRMDYVIKHLPQLLLLSGLIKVDIEYLRDQMLGTPRIVEKGDPELRWGLTCGRTLEAVHAHPSYASNNYYVWTYFQYFKSLFQCLESIKKVLAPNANGIIVVQDSYYKDIRIDLSAIVVEMLGSLGLIGLVIVKDKVKTSYRQLNPARNGVAKGLISSEDVIFFRQT